MVENELAELERIAKQGALTQEEQVKLCRYVRKLLKSRAEHVVTLVAIQAYIERKLGMRRKRE
jgi:hypothetical protein